MTDELEKIDRYLQGIMPDAEREAFELQIKNNAVLREQVKELEVLQLGIIREGRKQLHNQLKSIDKTLPQMASTKKSFLFDYGWKVAAVLLLGFSFWFLWPQQNIEQQLAADYFEAYPNLIIPTIRGVEQNDSTLKAKAFFAYDQKAYKEAISLFESIPQKDETILLYLGNCYLALGNPEKAIPLLEDVLKKSDMFDEQAQWYLAVSYLKLENRGKAKQLLQQIAGSGSTYQEKAKQILSKLN